MTPRPSSWRSCANEVRSRLHHNVVGFREVTLGSFNPQTRDYERVFAPLALAQKLADGSPSLVFFASAGSDPGGRAHERSDRAAVGTV
jgi:hypothetical protein